jgi:hypothetical protein
MWTAERKLIILILFFAGLWPVALYFLWKWTKDNEEKD